MCFRDVSVKYDYCIVISYIIELTISLFMHAAFVLFQGGPCQNHQCYNKGRCEADPVAAMAICICPIGLSGTNCQTSKFQIQGIVQVFVINLSKNTFAQLDAKKEVNQSSNLQCFLFKSIANISPKLNSVATTIVRILHILEKIILICMTLANI